ncbi:MULTISPECIES: cupin domain-containing protein [Streptomyces]|uniref:cupin domain-containing protein n=1 Tax=Streptomyces TaxID=1883 RepID=UPI0036942EAC
MPPITPPTRMQYIRPFDPDQAIDTGFPGYRAQFLSHLESAILINSHIEEGGCGPGLHYHHVDQLYYLVEGTMNVQLGHEVQHISAGILVFIPAGLAHRNWNDGPGAETHFEMLIPAPGPMAQLAYMVDSPDDVPASHRTDHPGYTRRVDPEALDEAMPGLKMLALASPATGARHTVVNYMEVAPGGAGPGTHIHAFDQYYLVLEGELTVEIALEKHVVGPRTLVVLPAGVPHRQYNAGTMTEKHLAVLSPAPEPVKPWDSGVDFSANGHDATGPQSVFEQVGAGRS